MLLLLLRTKDEIVAGKIEYVIFKTILFWCFEEQGVYIWEQFNFVTEYFCLFDLAFFLLGY